MIDLVQLQDDVFALLMSAAPLSTVNIVQERRFIVQSGIELDTIWQTVRNGRSGCGILCEMPTLNLSGKNSIFPANLLGVPFVVFQNGDVAFAPETGCGLSAEHIAQHVLDILHHQEIQNVGTLYAEERAIEPAREFDFINAYRVTLFLKTSQTNQTLRCAPVSITNNSGTITLATTESGAEIYYTLDGSAPAVATALHPVTGDHINTAATLYSTPFVAVSGQTVRAAAFLFEKNPSRISSQLIT